MLADKSSVGERKAGVESMDGMDTASAKPDGMGACGTSEGVDGVGGGGTLPATPVLAAIAPNQLANGLLDAASFSPPSPSGTGKDEASGAP